MYAACAAGWCSCLTVSFVFVKTIVPCFFVYTVGFGAFVWYNVAVSLEVGGIKQGDVLLFFIGAFVCQGGDIQKAHNVYYV